MMDRPAGAYIEQPDGTLTPDLSDEAMAGRQPVEEKPKKSKAEVSDAQK